LLEKFFWLGAFCIHHNAKNEQKNGNVGAELFFLQKQQPCHAMSNVMNDERLSEKSIIS